MITLLTRLHAISLSTVTFYALYGIIPIWTLLVSLISVPCLSIAFSYRYVKADNIETIRDRLDILRFSLYILLLGIVSYNIYMFTSTLLMLYTSSFFLLVTCCVSNYCSFVVVDRIILQSIHVPAAA